MARNPNTTMSGGPFSEATIEAVWRKGSPVSGSPSRRRDRCNALMQRVRYGKTMQHGWEIDHILPVSKGGTDRLNNLKPAHIHCNRSKQARSSRSARRAHGRTRAPMSAEAIARTRWKRAGTGALVGGGIGLRIGGPAGSIVGVIVGGIGGYALDPEE